jgi:hypothetical protein
LTRKISACKLEVRKEGKLKEMTQEVQEQQRPDRKDLKIMALRESLTEAQDRVANLRVELTERDFLLEDLRLELSRVLGELSQYVQEPERELDVLEETTDTSE